MKKLLIVCCLLLIATSLFAVELKPYKYGDSKWFHVVDENETTTVLGKPLKSGYISKANSFILFNLDNAYNELVLTVGVSDDYRTTSSSKITFYVDGVKVKTVSVNCDSMPDEITVPLNYKRQLKISTERFVYANNEAIVLTDLNFR